MLSWHYVILMLSQRRRDGTTPAEYGPYVPIDHVDLCLDLLPKVSGCTDCFFRRDGSKAFIAILNRESTLIERSCTYAC